LQVPVPDAATLVRLVSSARRIPSTAVSTARLLPDIAKYAVHDGGRRARGTALAVTGAAVSGAASVATSLLARRGGASGGDGADVLDLRPESEGNTFASAFDVAAEADRARTEAAADTAGDEGPGEDVGPDAWAPAEGTAAEDTAAEGTISEPSAAEPAGADEPPVDEAVAAGAPGTATELADRVAAEVAGADDAPSGADIAHADLPLPNFDHLTIGSLRARLRSLDIEQLVTLRSYELAHAHRLQVLTALENRIARLEKDAGSQTDG
jgi:hypothetical protein